MPTAKTLNVTVDMINNFNSLLELLQETFLRDEELEEGEDKKPSETSRQFKKLLLHEYIPQIDIDHFEELAEEARSVANQRRMEETGKGENIIDSGIEEEVEGGEF
jgi:hypothetical protein